MRAKAIPCPNPKCDGTDMRRTYIKPIIEGKQRYVAVGWWCPLCGWFMND